MTTAPTDRILRQGRALVRAIKALGTIEPSGPIERALARLLLYVYKRRLRGSVEAAPACVTEDILSISEGIENRREHCARLGTSNESYVPPNVSPVSTDDWHKFVWRHL